MVSLGTAMQMKDHFHRPYMLFQTPRFLPSTAEQNTQLLSQPLEMRSTHGAGKPSYLVLLHNLQESLLF